MADHLSPAAFCADTRLVAKGVVLGDATENDSPFVLRILPSAKQLSHLRIGSTQLSGVPEEGMCPLCHMRQHGQR